MPAPQPLLTPIQIGNGPQYDPTRVRRGFQQLWQQMIDYVGGQIDFTNTITAVIGGGNLGSRFVTANTEATDTDSVIIFRGAVSGLVFTMPTGVDGRQFYFYNKNSNAVTLRGVGGEQFQQVSTAATVTDFVMSSYTNVHVVYLGGYWHPI